MKSLCLRAPIVIPGASAYPLAGTFSSVITPPPKPFDAVVAAGITLYGLTSPQRVLQTWTGATWRVSRSTDSAERDFVAPLCADILAWAPTGTVSLVREYDQTGNGHDNYIATASLRPTVDLSGTYPVAVYDGVDDYLSPQGALGWPRARAGMAVGFSVKPTTINDKTRCICAWMAPDGVDSSGAIQGTLDTGTAANTLRFVGSRITGDTVVTLTTPIAAGAWQALVASLNYTSGEASLRNGATIVTGIGLTSGVTANVDSAFLPRIGRSRNTGREMSARIAASVWIPQALSTAQSLLVEQALAQITSG